MRYVIFDIHGEYERFKSVLEKSNFNYNNDLIISIGDLCDRGNDTLSVLNEFLKIKNKIMIKGNHDTFLLDYLKNGVINNIWYSNFGGKNTVDSYKDSDLETKNKHIELLETQVNYHLDTDGNFFCHSGLYPYESIYDNDFDENYQYNSFLMDSISKHGINKFNESIEFVDDRIKRVIVGHKSIMKPIITDKFINGDTGCGKGGFLTLMNIDTLQMFVS